MDSLPFDPMVEMYDRTRTLNHECLALAIDYLCNRFPPATFTSLFEPGIGTGRIAMPFAQRGYRVTGVDISVAMLASLKARVAATEPPVSIEGSVADVTNLPFADGAFDLSIVVHLFYFIRNWQKAVQEIMRVTRPDGPVVLMHTGMGEEVPFLNELYKETCASLGSHIPTVGVSSTAQVVKYLTQLGCSIETVGDRWSWISRIRLRQAIEYMRSRAYSFTTIAPESIHSQAMAAIESHCRAAYGDLDAEVEVPNQVMLAIVSRHAGTE